MVELGVLNAQYCQVSFERLGHRLGKDGIPKLGMEMSG